MAILEKKYLALNNCHSVNKTLDLLGLWRKLAVHYEQSFEGNILEKRTTPLYCKWYRTRLFIVNGIEHT